jgi:hypothetical protein
MHIDHSHRRLTSGVPQTSSGGHSSDIEGSCRSLPAVVGVDFSSPADRRPTLSTSSQRHPSVSSMLSVRNPSPATRAVIDLKRSDLPEPSIHLGCPSVAPEGETAERIAVGVGLPSWDRGRDRGSTSTTPIEG